MPGRRTIALLIESSRAYGRGLLRGIAKYANGPANWGLLHQEWELDEKMPAWLVKGSCDGVIARIETTAQLRALRKLAVPVVDLRGLRRYPDTPLIETDDQVVSRLAADHLLARGFRSLAYCGIAGANYSSNRRQHYVDYLRGVGIEPLIYEGLAVPRGATTRQRESEAMFHERELGHWLEKLPKPIGMMACNDIRGRQVLSACRDRKILVPDEVAVIGIDNDEVLCELANPPLSSVIPATERIGYEASELLDRMLRGKAPGFELQLVQPLGIATRRSTDIMAIEDPVIKTAIQFIRENVCANIKVPDVLEFLSQRLPDQSISRSTLERKFFHLLGRSPKDEILRVRIERIRQLLLETNDSVATIASSVGMDHAEHLSAIFKRETGDTPGAYRLRATTWHHS